MKPYIGRIPDIKKGRISGTTLTIVICILISDLKKNRNRTLLLFYKWPDKSTTDYDMLRFQKLYKKFVMDISAN